MKADQRAAMWKERFEESQKARKSQERRAAKAEREVERLRSLLKERGIFKELRVEPVTAELGRYRVTSRTEADEMHMVDILANRGTGECSCKFWQTVVSKNATVRKAVQGDSYLPIPYQREGACLCAHLEAARDIFVQQFLNALAGKTQPTIPDDEW